MASRFKLEAVYAGKGDALILHHGTDAKPRWILIDGGHRRVYERFLRPRLDELRIEFASHLTDHGQLPLDLVMLSHADQDHVLGLLDLKRHMESHFAQTPDGGGQGIGGSLDAPPVDISAMWINGFDDIAFDIPESRPAALEDELAKVAGNDRGAWMMSCLPEETRLDDELGAWIASTGECRELRQFATGIGQIPINQQFGGDLVRRDAPGYPSNVELAGRLQITVLGPDQARIDALRSKWKDDLKKILKNEQSNTTAFSDSSKHNLSSIMVMVERKVKNKTKRMLLTGDGRGDHLVDGLQAQGYLDHGFVHVDLFKLPHHGSDRNVKQQTFEKVIADNYLISANGEHHNPEVATLEMLVAGRAKAGVTSDFNIHFTFPERAFAAITDEQAEQSSTMAKQREALRAVHDWLEMRRARLGTNDPMTPVFREKDRFSVTVELDR